MIYNHFYLRFLFLIKNKYFKEKKKVYWFWNNKKKTLVFLVEHTKTSSLQWIYFTINCYTFSPSLKHINCTLKRDLHHDIIVAKHWRAWNNIWTNSKWFVNANYQDNDLSKFSVCVTNWTVDQDPSRLKNHKTSFSDLLIKFLRLESMVFLKILDLPFTLKRKDFLRYNILT